jgi:hypothetical protein
MSEWQDIKTAPKDGSTFLAFDADDGGGIYCGVVACRWMHADEDDEWESEWIVSEVGGDSELHGCNLTHWMPLPAPPKREKPNA